MGGGNDTRNLMQLCYDCNFERKSEVVEPGQFLSVCEAVGDKEVSGLSRRVEKSAHNHGRCVHGDAKERVEVTLW